MIQERIRMGIEWEALRMTPEGTLALSPHPFGETENFTRDFSESQTEIVTGVLNSVDEVMEELKSLIAEAEREMGRELFWPFSMPPRLPRGEDIPLARFGEDDESRRNYHYRKGLALRYGKARQMISGIHVNLSLQDEAAGETADLLYLRTARFLYGHLASLLLLTGAAPVPSGKVPAFREPVVSLRNSSIGYAGNLYREFLSLESLEAYISGIEEGLCRVYPPYQSFGLVDRGSILQLSNRVFQSEKEFYAPIRLRGRSGKGETNLQALKREGISYLELRFLDKNPHYPGGINPDVLYLLELLFLKGMDEEGPVAVSSALERADRIAGTPLVRILGRGDPGTEQLFYETAEMLEALRPLAAAKDESAGSSCYRGALDRLARQLHIREELPSMRVYEDFACSGRDWTAYGMELARLKSPEDLNNAPLVFYQLNEEKHRFSLANTML